MITWDFKITVISADEKTASVTAIRIDNTDPNNILVETHQILSAVLDTQVQKSAAVDELWNQHLAYQVRQSKIAAFIGNLEEQGKTNLEGRES